MQIGMPITGKYRDPESDQYYNHNDVSLNLITERIGEKNTIEFWKYYRK